MNPARPASVTACCSGLDGHLLAMVGRLFLGWSEHVRSSRAARPYLSMWSSTRSISVLHLWTVQATTVSSGTQQAQDNAE